MGAVGELESVGVTVTCTPLALQPGRIKSSQSHKNINGSICVWRLLRDFKSRIIIEGKDSHTSDLLALLYLKVPIFIRHTQFTKNGQIERFL